MATSALVSDRAGGRGILAFQKERGELPDSVGARTAMSVLIEPWCAWGLTRLLFELAGSAARAPLFGQHIVVLGFWFGFAEKSEYAGLMRIRIIWT